MDNIATARKRRVRKLLLDSGADPSGFWGIAVVVAPARCSGTLGSKVQQSALPQVFASGLDERLRGQVRGRRLEFGRVGGGRCLSQSLFRA